MTKSTINLKVEFKKKPRLVIILLLGLFIAISLVIIFSIIYGLINDHYYSDLIPVIILIVLVDLWVIDRFLWQINGVEQLMITDKIEIVKKGKLFKTVRIIDFQEYESINYDNDKSTPYFVKLYGLYGGKIIISYLGRSTRIGQDISISKAEIIVKEFESQINKIKNNYA